RLGSDYRYASGIRTRNRRGPGSEFQELRDYRLGDSMRQIDWRATARTRKPIAREYQDERDQNVVFLLDCGRRMRAVDGVIGHFDAALNAVLLMSYIALRQGDSVAVATVASDGRWLAPVKGAAMTDRILNALYDLEPSNTIPDYNRAATELLLKVRKHSLVVLVTNLRTEDSEELLPAVRLLGRRHRVVVASLGEAAVREASRAEPTSFTQAVTAAATANYLADRARALSLLRARGVLCVDAQPSRFSEALASAYLEIKAAGAF
nr:DUF58 domain-containing protein [Gammaproteobacteria bacterium]